MQTTVSTERVRDCRARRRQGRAIFQIEADAVQLTEALVAEGLLEPDHSHVEVCAALQRVVATWIESEK